MEALREGALKSIEEVFGDRLKRRPPESAKSDSDGALASVFPTSAEEVELLSRTAELLRTPGRARGRDPPPDAGEGRSNPRPLRPHAGPSTSRPRRTLGRGRTGRAVARAGQRTARPREGPDGLPHERPEGHRRGLAGPGRHRGRLLRVRLVE